uniref:Uncharacterized protein n=1 Tax=Arundo donax TaxID=35708 RepID=A0A0A9H6A7_ARUDO
MYRYSLYHFIRILVQLVLIQATAASLVYMIVYVLHTSRLMLTANNLQNVQDIPGLSHKQTYR